MKLLFPLFLCVAAFGQSPTIRSKAITTSSSSPAVVTLPAGTAIGDLVILFAANENALNNPTGFTVVSNIPGLQISGGAWSKVMNSSDISTGSVTINPSGGALVAGAYGIYAITGGTTTGVRTSADQQNAIGAASRMITTDSSPVSTDLGLYFGSNRFSSGNTVTISPGTNDGQASAAVSGAIYSDTSLAGGAVTVTFSYSAGVSGSGDYEVVVIVKGATSRIRHSVRTN